MEQTVTLHLEKLVTVLGLLDATLEFDQLTTGWFDVKRHGFTSEFKPCCQDDTSQSTFGQDERDTWCQSMTSIPSRISVSSMERSSSRD